MDVKERDALFDICGTLFSNNDAVNIYFDIDDTVCPKFVSSQDLAINKLFSNLEDRDLINASLREMVLEYKRYTAPINGLEYKLVYFLKYLSLNNHLDDDKSMILSAMSEIVAKYNKKDHLIVNEVNNFLQSDLFLYKNCIYSPDLRSLEAEYSVSAIKSKEAYFYQDIYNAKKLLEQKFKNKIQFRLITNKPKIVLEKIYNVPIEIK